jgi:DNA-binding NtrC family response regulator
MSSLLVVEDEQVLAKNIRRTLEKLGHQVQVAATGAEAERLFAELRPDLTLLDLRLPDASGLDLLPRFKATHPDGIVLLMTAYAAVEDAVRAIQLGARDYLQKPLHMEDLRHAVARALEDAQLHQEVAYYRERESKGADIDSIAGNCAAIDSLRAKVRRLGSLPASAAPPTVLITGETGTGKGLLARVLHYNGPRAGHPFIEVNCAAIPENLVEAELFGYEKGAFTDAKTSRLGLLQAADGGSIFLDEIGCLSLPFQMKILKAIEEKTVRPVGARRERPIDVQIIAATNSDLAAMVAAHQFREDLYYRLRVAPLEIPPLRERGEDVLLLARKFLAELCAVYRLPPRRLSPEAEEIVRRYRWPGNVRELRNTLDRAVLFSDAEVLEPAALGLPAESAAELSSTGAASCLSFDIPDAGIRFEDVERSLILSALRKAGGSQSGAARLLGMTRDTLRYRMEKFGLQAKTES